MTLGAKADAMTLLLGSAAIVGWTSVVGYVCFQHGKKAGENSRKKSTEIVNRTKGNVGPRGLEALAPPIPCKRKLRAAATSRLVTPSLRISSCITHSNFLLSRLYGTSSTNFLNADLDKFLYCLEDLCDAIDNPQGHIPLCVAENKLVLDMLTDRFFHCSANGFTDPSVYTYNNFRGIPVAREAAAYFLARRFLFPRSTSMLPEQALMHCKPEHVAFGAGCAALINHLFYLLGAEGDCCLVPKPYYAAFENDMGLLAKIAPWGVSQEHPMRGPTVDELQKAYNDAKSQGYRPKFVLLTNPNNPLGVVYSPQVLRETVEWARAHDMHTIVDEIYALSTQNPLDFQSIIHVLNNDLRDDVHMLWAVSKDFGASGLRVGLVYTQNEVLLEGIATLNTLSGVSGPIQYLVAELLTDDEYVDMFLAESRKRLRRSYSICTSKLEEMVLPFCPANSGLFIYVDMSGLLPEKTFEYEAELLQLMFRYARVVLTPGESQREDSPGMFRICYAWVPPDVLEIALERLSRFVAKVRRIDWKDLGHRAFRDVIEY